MSLLNYQYQIAKDLCTWIKDKSRQHANEKLHLKDAQVALYYDIERLDTIGSPLALLKIDTQELTLVKPQNIQQRYNFQLALLFLVAGNKDVVLEDACTLTDYLRTQIIEHPQALYQSDNVYLMQINSISAVEYIERKEATDYVYRNINLSLWSY